MRSTKPGFTTRIRQITAINPNAIKAGTRLAGVNVTQSRKQKNQSDTRQLWFEKRIADLLLGGSKNSISSRRRSAGANSGRDVINCMIDGEGRRRRGRSDSSGFRLFDQVFDKVLRDRGHLTSARVELLSAHNNLRDYSAIRPDVSDHN